MRWSRKSCEGRSAAAQRNRVPFRTNKNAHFWAPARRAFFPEVLNSHENAAGGKALHGVTARKYDPLRGHCRLEKSRSRAGLLMKRDCVSCSKQLAKEKQRSFCSLREGAELSRCHNTR